MFQEPRLSEFVEAGVLERVEPLLNSEEISIFVEVDHSVGSRLSLWQVAWFYSYMSAHELELVELLLQRGLLQQCAQQLQRVSATPEAVTPMLRTLGNLVLSTHLLLKQALRHALSSDA